MASGTLGAEEAREKPRWNENSKVYTRKFHKKANKNVEATNNQNTNTVTTSNTDDTTTTTNINDKETALKDESTPNLKRDQYRTAQVNEFTQIVDRNENGTVQKDKSIQLVNGTTQEDDFTQNVHGNETMQEDESTHIVNINAITAVNISTVQPPELQSPDANSRHQQPSSSPRIEVISGDTDHDHDGNVGNESTLVRPEVREIDNNNEFHITAANNSNSVTQQLDLHSPLADDVNSRQEQPNSAPIEVVCGDTSSFNQQNVILLNDHHESTFVKPVVTRIDNDRVRISFSAIRSKQERRDLKRKLVSELGNVQFLAKKLRDKESRVNQYIGELATGNVVLPGGKVPSLYPTNGGLVGFNNSRPFSHLSVPVMDNTRCIVDILDREKRTPKANQYYRSSDFIFETDKLPPVESNKKSKSHGSKKRGGGSATDKQIFKKCSSLLTKLMKHHYGWVFNTPVDVKKMGLHDYYDIIKHPMDLGTVKSRLRKNWYKSPSEFAEDIRLTFRNAKIYNPEGQDVHAMAVDLSNIFEEMWVEIEEYRVRLRYEATYDMGLPTPASRRAPWPSSTYTSPPQPFIPARPLPPPPVYQETRHLDRSEPFVQPVESRPKPVFKAPAGRTPALKKPKAKDTNKRDMTLEEKQKLSINLQDLPPERLDSVVQIIKKRNSTVSQHDNEIEVDINCVDVETLWELDRFVTNYKKSLSKHRRKAEIARQKAELQQAMQNPVPPRAEAYQERRAEDTNVVAHSSPTQELNKADNAASDSSSSSSSSSDSGSSSSDSDSDSSSGSDSNGG